MLAEIDNGPLLGACVVVLIAIIPLVWLVAVTFRDLRQWVLPHFAPSDPGEEDKSLPARMGRMETGVAQYGAELRTHVQNEEAKDLLAEKERADERRFVRDEFVKGAVRFDTIDASLAELNRAKRATD